MGHKKPIIPDNGSHKDHYEPDIQPDTNLGQFTQTPPKPPITAGKAVANVLGFFGGLLAWMAKNPIVAIGLVLLVCLMAFGLPFGLGKSKGELRLERELAEANARVAEHEARLGEIARDLAVNTERDRTRRTQVITQAQQEIEDATAQVDPDAQYSAYIRGYLCLLDAGACASRSDPAPAGTDPVRSPGANAA